MGCAGTAKQRHIAFDRDEQSGATLAVTYVVMSNRLQPKHVTSFRPPPPGATKGKDCSNRPILTQWTETVHDVDSDWKFGHVRLPFCIQLDWFDWSEQKVPSLRILMDRHNFTQLRASMISVLPPRETFLSFALLVRCNAAWAYIWFKKDSSSRSLTSLPSVTICSLSRRRSYEDVVAPLNSRRTNCCISGQGVREHTILQYMWQNERRYRASLEGS